MEFLKEKKSSLLDKWKDVALLPEQDGKSFFRNTDQFGSPVAWTTAVEMERIYDSIIGELDEKQTEKSLDSMMRIRAVQDASPSASVMFLSNFKDLVRKEFKDLEKLKLKSGETVTMTELISFETRIDTLIHKTFDIYMGCREHLFRLKLDQIEQGSPLKQECPSHLLDEMPKVEFKSQLKQYQGENK